MSQIERYEMELIANRNFLLPRLDIVGLYRWRGYGHRLMGAWDPATPYDNAFANLTSGQFQEWELGFQYNMPIGFRREYAAVRNSQFRVARERAILRRAGAPGHSRPERRHGRRGPRLRRDARRLQSIERRAGTVSPGVRRVLRARRQSIARTGARRAHPPGRIGNQLPSLAHRLRGRAQERPLRKRFVAGLQRRGAGRRRAVVGDGRRHRSQKAVRRRNAAAQLCAGAAAHQPAAARRRRCAVGGSHRARAGSAVLTPSLPEEFKTQAPAAPLPPKQN